MQTGPIAELPAQVVVDVGDDMLLDMIRECLAHPLSETFRQSLEVLVAMVRGTAGATIRIWRDFAPLSFAWSAVNSKGKNVATRRDHLPR